MIPFIRNVQKRPIYRDRKYINGSQGLGWEQEVTANGQDGSFWGDDTPKIGSKIESW